MSEEKRINIQEWVKRFESGEFDNNDIVVQIDAGWYDWFCKDSSLARKTKSLGAKVKRIVKANEIGKRFDAKSVYVFFKNNCPLSAGLYDDFRICDIENGDVLFTITPNYSVNNKSEVYGRMNDFETPLIQADSFNDVVLFFSGNTAQEIRDKKQAKIDAEIEKKRIEDLKSIDAKIKMKNSEIEKAKVAMIMNQTELENLIAQWEKLRK